MRRKALAGVLAGTGALLLVVCLGWGAPPAASFAAAPIGHQVAPQATLSSWSVRDGGLVNVTGTGFEPGTEVRVMASGLVLAPPANVTCGPTGRVVATIRTGTGTGTGAGTGTGWATVVLRGHTQGGQALVEEAELRVVR